MPGGFQAPFCSRSDKVSPCGFHAQTAVSSLPQTSPVPGFPEDEFGNSHVNANTGVHRAVLGVWAPHTEGRRLARSPAFHMVGQGSLWPHLRSLHIPPVSATHRKKNTHPPSMVPQGGGPAQPSAALAPQGPHTARKLGEAGRGTSALSNLDLDRVRVLPGLLPRVHCFSRDLDLSGNLCPPATPSWLSGEPADVRVLVADKG